jgi:Fe-S cluster assembly protein SufD
MDMTTATSPTTFSQDGLHQLLDSRDEPAWLRDMRTEAWDSFCEMNWPARNHEEWIRTDIRLFKLDKYRPLIEPLGEAPHSGALLADGVQLDGRVSSLDGRPQFSELAPKWAERGVIFGSLEQLVTQHSELVREHLFSVMDRHYDRFAALHAAFWGGGALLYATAR